MKNFKEFMIEDSGLSTEHRPYDLSDESVKAKVNAVLGHTATVEFMTVEAALGQLNSKLSQLGLTKEVGGEASPEREMDTLDVNESGTHTISYKRMEAFGKSVDTPHDEFETGKESYNLSLKVERLETGSYKVYGSLV